MAYQIPQDKQLLFQLLEEQAMYLDHQKEGTLTLSTALWQYGQGFQVFQSKIPQDKHSPLACYPGRQQTLVKSSGLVRVGFILYILCMPKFPEPYKLKLCMPRGEFIHSCTKQGQ